MSGVRLAVRAVIVRDGRLLLVNAYPGAVSDLWCAPGGGVEAGRSLEENLIREVFEETGLTIDCGRLLAVSEFHDAASDYHQVDLIYRAEATRGATPVLVDPEGIVNRLRWASEFEMADIRSKPDCLTRIAFGPDGPVIYDPLETLVR